MTRTNLITISGLFVLLSFISSHVYSQSPDDLVGRWEGVHYYGDTTRFYDGSLLVRSSTIDSMKMILTVEKIVEGKFKGTVHEHFYSDPGRNYFNAEVTGFIDNEKIHFTSFHIKENRLPRGNKWCEPKATGVMIKKTNSIALNIFFETSLTCTIGPAILARNISEKIPKPVQQAPQKTVVKNPPPVTNQPVVKAPIPVSKPGTPSIAEKFKTRSRLVVTTFKVQSDSIKVNFFDNGTIDGDSISVFINGELQASHVLLTTKVYSITVGFEKGKDEIEVAMFAENLGTIPPNTALMQIVDGSKVHQAYLSSDTKSSAVIKIKKVKL